MKIRAGMIAAFSVFSLIAAPGHAAERAQSFPSKPIRIIVPYSPGGTTDMLARMVGKKLNDKWGKPVLVENRPGANGMIGMDFVAKSPADGYTLGLASPGTHAINQSLYSNMTHDPIKDFQPVTLLVEAPMALVVNSSVPVSSVKELIAMMKAQPGKISFASGGNGSSQHLAFELFRSMAGVDAIHVPYKGGGAAYVDLASGRVNAMIDAWQQAKPQVQSGKLKVLAVASSKRLAELPDVPTIAEAGVPGFQTQAWYGLVAPAGLPKDVLTRLNTEIVAAVNRPEVRNQWTEMGLVPVGNTPEQFAQYIRNETAKYAKLIKENNIKAE
jgi:tripartite-type tricarboxylate transporter receptor subunit TctC